MKFYLCASYERREELKEYAKILRGIGYEVTSEWLEVDDASQSDSDIAERDIADIMAADVLVAFTEPEVTTRSRGGRHVELGIAIARGMQIVVIGHRENVFCWHDPIFFYSSWQSFEMNWVPARKPEIDAYKPVPEDDEPQEIVGGLQFTVVPRFELVPRAALLRLVRRVELGERTKGKHAWNALSDNQDALKNKDALAKRLGHAIDHATKLLSRLIAGEKLFEGDEDDAAALMWAGMYACCATESIEKERIAEDAKNETTVRPCTTCDCFSKVAAVSPHLVG